MNKTCLQLSLLTEKQRAPFRLSAGWLIALTLFVLLWAPVAVLLWRQWGADSSLSHGPLIPIIVAVLIWSHRKALDRWDSASAGGLVFLIFSGLLFVGSIWADIEFLKPLSLIMMALGGVWFLGGPKAALAVIGPLGFLVFMIPWPTVLVDRISFPLQLASSAYAAMFGGICGLPIHREGVQLSVLPDPEGKPIYSIIVATKCSGITSLMVLLALGYLIAYYTEVKIGWRMLMVAAVIPLTLFTNAVRLTFILLAGAHYSAALAKWIHDNEGPVLIFFCSIGLMALRQALLTWTNPNNDDSAPGEQPKGGADEAMATVDR